jgi:NAD(P)-dependent dehydrogenase (short-subunit alcohol dehydrogenase family)
MKRLENKIVFITGGNSGIGKAAGLEAAREGATVVVADLPETDHEQTLNEIKALGGKCMFVPIDVAKVDSVKTAITKTVAEYGRLDIALNNAGIGGTASGIHDMPEETWDKIISINLTGQFYCVKYELQQFLKQGGGVIVNMASLGGLKAEPGLIPYTAAKHGVLGITKNIAVQYGHQNIRANTICPYYVETPMISSVPDEMHKAWIEGTPMQRLCKPEEVAKAFIYLASSDSSYCNGTQLILDGGFMA